MAQTLPSDLYIPTVALNWMAYNFYENLGLMKFAGPDATNPIVLRASGPLASGGQYIDGPTFKPIGSLDTRRDLTSESDATPVKIESRNDKGVRVSRKGLASFTKSATWVNGTSPAQLSEFFAREARDNMMLTIRQFILGCATAAVGNMTSTLHTKDVWNASVRTNLSTSLLAQTKALLADAAEKVEPGSGSIWVFRSEPYYTDLVQSNISAGVDGLATNAANGGPAATLGLPFALADDAALTVADAGFDKYRSLLIGPGAIEVNVIRMEFEPLWVNPKAENVEFVLRYDYDFDLRIPGFQYDSANGGANPALATASTTTNWDVNYSSHKEVLLAYAQHNYSGN
jgi:hypothetical protein